MKLLMPIRTTNFTLNNSFIAATDMLILSNVGATGHEGRYLLNAVRCKLRDNLPKKCHRVRLSDALVIAFAVIKAVTS